MFVPSYLLFLFLHLWILKTDEWIWARGLIPTWQAAGPCGHPALFFDLVFSFVLIGGVLQQVSVPSFAY